MWRVATLQGRRACPVNDVIRRSSPAAGTMVRDMSRKSDAAVGRLAIMDGALNGLLRDLVTETTGADATSLTTGKAAQALLKDLKHDAALLTTDVRDWLTRVIQAAEARNKIMHAIARDQCVICGDASQFDHRGKSVDRSAAAVTAVSADFKSLIDEGVRHARDISHTLNARARTAAVKDAADTDAVQGPKQVLIGQAMYRCAKCSPGGKPVIVVALPAAVAVLPPSTQR